jgi:hypothetical protein
MISSYLCRTGMDPMKVKFVEILFVAGGIRTDASLMAARKICIWNVAANVEWLTIAARNIKERYYEYFHYDCHLNLLKDWSKHRSDCAVFAKLGLRAKFYDDLKMRFKHPVNPQLVQKTLAALKEELDKSNIPISGDWQSNENKLEASCPLCGTCPDATNPLKLTTCCRQRVCETQLGSFGGLTRINLVKLIEFIIGLFHCERSHERYTLCGGIIWIFIHINHDVTKPAHKTMWGTI